MRARREDKTDVLIPKLSSRDKQEAVLSLEHLLEAGGVGVGGGRCCTGVREGRCPLCSTWNEPAHKHDTTRPSRFPPDSQQISDRLTPPEQWDESGDGFLCVPARLRRTTSQCYPFCRVAPCVLPGKKTFPATLWGRGKPLPPKRHKIRSSVCVWDRGKALGSNMDFCLLSPRHLLEFQVPNLCDQRRTQGKNITKHRLSHPLYVHN